MTINNIKIKNFTVFEELDIDLSSGINVFIGENGTGKTQLLKLMNILVRPKVKRKKHYDDIFEYFNIKNNKDVIRVYNNDNASAYVEVECDNSTIAYTITNIDISCNISNGEPIQWDNVYIPAKEILTNSKGFISIYDERYIPFDKSYKDLLSKSLLPNLRSLPALGINILPKLEKIMDGIVVVEDDVFYIQKNNGSQVVFDLEAEGIKKLALIWQLLVTGCIAKGSIVFWDEADSNVNPKLFSDIANILLELSRNGVQIFLTTHDYVLAKYIEVLKNDEDSVMFYSLYKNENGKIECEQDKVYEHIVNNSIRDENVVLYEAELDKVFG